MSVQLTMIKTDKEHWMQQVGLKDAFISFEFSEEHQIRKEGDRTVIKIDKQSALYKAFNKNQNDLFKLGVEHALQKVLKQLSLVKLNKKLYTSLKELITKELKKEKLIEID